MKSTDRYWQLVSRYLAGEATPDEIKELEQLKASSDALRIKFEQLTAYWNKSHLSSDVNVREAYDKVLQKIDTEAVRPLKRTVYSISWAVRAAAVAILAIGVGWYFLASDSPQLVWVSLAWESKVTSHGERSKLTLSDGSTVWLNAASEINYPSEFGKGAREIYLTGEAFFDVVKDPAKPFIIHLQSGDVRVLGTSFNVKAFEDDANVETSVVTGKVAFIPPGEPGHRKDTVLITPNYKAVYTKFSGLVKTHKTNSADDKAWADGRLVFKSQRFEDVAKILERSYGKSIVFDNDAVKECRLTGTFQNNTLDEVMVMLAQTRDYVIHNKQNTWHINGQGCMSVDDDQ